MIVASLLLILLAVVLLVVGLAGGSSLLLIVSIAASLLAAVALVVGARQAAADRATAGRAGRRVPTASRPTGSTSPAAETSAYAPVTEPYGPPVDLGIPVQHVPPTVDTGGSGWRQPPEPSVGTGQSGADPAYDDEPVAQQIDAADLARLARLTAEVRVVDGRPRYHLGDCPHLVGREHEALPVAEAVDLGFTPCAHCAPATTLLAGRIASGGAGA
ncbi:hypothetical protein [Micromonospora sp. NPDC049799]|uniref:hypothetical protein n=1 Tax=Micromonospora sp. NPDC049799 TaxID=3154741 RepID=UPI00340ECFC9